VAGADEDWSGAAVGGVVLAAKDLVKEFPRHQGGAAAQVGTG